jgi:hypothetical protein
MLRCRPIGIALLRARTSVTGGPCPCSCPWSWPSAAVQPIQIANVRQGSNISSSNSSAANNNDDEHLRAARLWLRGLRAEAIPLRSIGDLSYSRSSGPGGQNVNKYDQLAKVKRRAILSMAQKSQFKGYFEGSPGRTAKICPLRYSWRAQTVALRSRKIKRYHRARRR